MAKKRIVIDVRPDGTMVATTHGVRGAKCLDEVARIEALTGATAEASSLTADYHLPPEVDEVTDQAQVTEGGA